MTVPTRWEVIKAPVVTEKALRMKDRPADEGHQVLVFRQELGLTPTAYRRQMRSPMGQVGD